MENENCLSLAETQEIYLELMTELDRICRENGLRYDLGGGSLLGAVRHGGFIPWDDDIDVNMPRPDYERLLALCTGGELTLPEKRQLVSDRDGTFPRHFARYVRQDVRRLADMAEDWDCPYIGIDIFPIDGVPENDRRFRHQVWMIRQLRRFLLTSVEKKGTSRRGKFSAAIKDCYRPILRAIGPFRMAKALDRVCARVDFDTAEYVGGISGMYGLKEKWKKTDMLPQTELPFAGQKFLAVANYDIYLTNLYGDYMALPPEEKRVPHCDRCVRVED